MSYRKFKADYLWTGWQWAATDAVLITTAEGIVQALVPAAEAGEGIEAYPGMLCPGFINCHCHLELSHLRDQIPSHTGLVDFLLGVMATRQPHPNAVQSPPDAYNPQVRIREAIAAAEQEMIENGIVAVGDICNSTDTLEQKKGGHLAYYNFIETMGFIEKGAPDRFAAAVGIQEQFERAFPGCNAVVPHAPYSVSPALFRLIATFAGDRLLTIHSQETAAENEFYLTGEGDFLRLYKTLGLDISFFRGAGKRSLAAVIGFFRPEQPLILVHGVETATEDIDILEGRPEIFFCLCPNANLYIGGKLPDVEMLAARGCRLVVGTDSLASNKGLSILAELLTLQEAFPALETARLLEWATAGGAAALRLDDRFGSFSPGLRPGVLLLQGLEGDRLTAATIVRRLV